MARAKRVKHVEEPTHSPVPTNTSGLPSLPVELLHEIVSWLTAAPKKPLVPSLKPTPSFDQEVIDIFRALSQTSQRLRQFFLPLAWQHLEIQLPSRRFNAAPSQRVTRLSSSLRAITDVIAPLVRSMSVRVEYSCPARVFSAFLSYLSLLIGPVTLFVLYDLSEGFSEAACEPYQIPAVRRLTVGPSAISLARSCPNLQQLAVLCRWADHLRFLPMTTSNRSLRSFMCTELDPDILNDMLMAIDSLPPTLEEVGLFRLNVHSYRKISVQDVVRLAQAPSIRSIHFSTWNSESWDVAEQAKVDQLLPQLAQKVKLAMCSKPSVQAGDVYVTLRFDEVTPSFYEWGQDGWVKVEQLKVIKYE